MTSYPQQPGPPQFPNNGGYPQQNPGYPQQNPGYPQQNQGYPQQSQGYPQQNPGYPQMQQFQQGPGPGYPQPMPQQGPSRGAEAARTAGRALGATGRAVGGFLDVVGIIFYHVLWGGIAVAGVALTGAIGPVALIATAVGVGLLILYWTTGWMFWFG